MKEERIAQLVTVPEWKTILLDLVEKNEIDPWDVDIVRLTSLYLEEIKRRKDLDLYVPANAVLASSILLYLKSRVLKEEKEKLKVPEEPEVFLEEPEEMPGVIEEIPEGVVVVPPGRIVRRRISLDELLEAMDKLMKRGVRKRPVEPPPDVEDFFDVVEEEDVEDYIAEVYSRILSSLDSTGMTTLSEITPADPLEFVKTLLAVLYLASEGKLEVFQEEVFGEVIIRVVG